jgi:mannonate dehydratase
VKIDRAEVIVTSPDRNFVTLKLTTDAVFKQSFSFTDGLMHPGDLSGLGVSLDVDEAGRYPYQTAYLPYNRLVDGTIHDW